LAAGADEYFQKAATVGQLVEQLRRAFPGRSMHIDTPSAGLDEAAEPLPLQRESLRGAAPATDQRFRALLDALEQGVLITDPVAVVTDANTAATRILQLPLGRVTGHTLTEVGLDDAGVIADGIRSGRRLQHLDYPLHQPDGTTHPVLLTVRPLPGAAGAPPGEYLISLLDPPGRDTERRARQVLDTTQEGVWSIDTDDVTTCVNARAAALLCYTVPEMVGTPIWEHISAESRAAARATIRTRRAGVSDVQEIELRRKDGATVPVLVSASPTLDADGHYQGALAMVTDISHRKRAEEALAATAQELRETIESMLDGVAVLTPQRATNGRVVDFRYTDINDTGSRLTHRHRDDLIGHLLGEVGPWPNDLIDDYIQAIHTGTPTTRRAVPLTVQTVQPATGQPTTRLFDIHSVPSGDSLVATWGDVTDQPAPNSGPGDTE
jgi:PAS domain S-box-containing protein